MGFALKGMVMGAANALSDIIDEERKSTSALIANKTKLAYENYKAKQQQDAALIEEIKKRDAEARLLDADLTEAQRIAIGADISNTFLSTYNQIRSSGNPNKIKLGDLIKFKESVPEQTFEEWSKQVIINPELSAAVKPVKEETMFGMSAAGQIKEAERLAASVGLTAGQLAAFEKPAERTVLSPVAFLNEEAARLPESPEDMQRRLFMNLSKARTGSDEERAAAEAAILEYADTKKKYDMLSGNLNYQSEFINNRAKAYSIVAEPAKYSAEDKSWADSFIKNDTNREIQEIKLREAATKGSIDISPFISAAIKNDVAMIPQREVAGVTYYGGSKRIKEGSPEANELLNSTKVAAVKRVLVGAGLVNDDGSIKLDKEAKTSLQLIAAGVELYKVDGKTYLEDPNKVAEKPNMLDTAREQGLDAVVKLIKDSIENGISVEEIKTSGRFTQDELKAAGLVDAATQPETAGRVPPPPPDPDRVAESRRALGGTRGIDDAKLRYNEWEAKYGDAWRKQQKEDDEKMRKMGIEQFQLSFPQ